MMWTHAVLLVVLFITQLQEVRLLNPCGYDQIFWKTANPANYSCLPCPLCPEATEPSIICGNTVDYGTPVQCVPCRTGTYSDNFDTNPCRVCTICADGEDLKSCTPTSNTVCRKNCPAGYYKNFAFNCVPCPKCCVSNLHRSGCEKKECQANQSCSPERSTVAPNTDAISTSPTPPSKSKSVLQLRTNSVLPTQDISMPLTKKRLEQSPRNPPSTSPWTKLKSQVLNSTRRTVPHTAESQAATSVAYVVAILSVFVLLCSLILCGLLLMTHRRASNRDSGNSPKTGNERANGAVQLTGNTDERQDASAPAVLTADTSDERSDTSEAVNSSVPVVEEKKSALQDSRNTPYQPNCTKLHTGAKGEMSLSTFSDTEHNAFDKICELLDVPTPGCGDYAHVAKSYGVKQCTIRSRFEKYEDGPSKALFAWLGCQKPELTVGDFIKVLRSDGIKRNDVATRFLVESEK